MEEAKRYYEEILGLKRDLIFLIREWLLIILEMREPAIILKDKNKFENLKPTIWFEVDVAIFYKEMLNNGIKF